MKNILCAFAVFILVCIIQYSLFSTPIFAAEEFGTSYDVAYDVSESGVTNVTQKVTLKNLTSQYYVSNFTLTVGSTEITDVSASDGQGAMETEIKKVDSKTSITVKFNAQVAGVGKTQNFTLMFKSRDFAQRLGKTWEVNLPKSPSGGGIEGYNLVLSVPVSFGDPTSISPQPQSESASYDRLFFTFTQNQLQKSGVSVNFGTTQVFDFNIFYPLENNSLFPVLTSIALPPDTAYQDVAITKIDPAPTNVVKDEDGNYLAWYRLVRGAKITVNVVGSVKLYIQSKDDKLGLTKNRPGLVAEQIQALTKGDRYWEKDSPAIQAVLREIFKDFNPHTNQEKARLIYRYVVDNLKYNTRRLESNQIERLGALTTLSNTGEAVCMEFTDLFIALSRAAGVPARELDGFAYTQNQSLRPLSLSKDLLHAWPEYFDPDTGWVMVDPTWENTSGGVDYFNKFDLNHVVLGIKGYSSQAPSISDSVQVTLSEGDFIPKSQILVELDLPSEVWSGLTTKATVRIKNVGNSLHRPTTLTARTERVAIIGDKTIGLSSIPAFGSSSYQFELRAPLFGEGFEDTFEIEVNGKIEARGIRVKPVFANSTYPYLVGGMALLFGGLYIAVLGAHLVWRPSRSRRR